MSASPDLASQMPNGKIATHHAVCAPKSTLRRGFLQCIDGWLESRHPRYSGERSAVVKRAYEEES
jgi:hypothetical protein